jgi:hypothetical protein
VWTQGLVDFGNDGLMLGQLYFHVFVYTIDFSTIGLEFTHSITPAVLLKLEEHENNICYENDKQDSQNTEWQDVCRHVVRI